MQLEGGGGDGGRGGGREGGAPGGSPPHLGVCRGEGDRWAGGHGGQKKTGPPVALRGVGGTPGKRSHMSTGGEGGRG